MAWVIVEENDLMLSDPKGKICNVEWIPKPYWRLLRWSVEPAFPREQKITVTEATEIHCFTTPCG